MVPRPSRSALLLQVKWVWASHSPDISVRGGATPDYDGFENWDSAFHRAIAQAAHNGLLLTLFDTMNAARHLPIWGGIKRRTATRERLARYHAEHTLILTALSERDPDAAHYHMREHLINVTNNLLGSNTAWRTTGTEKRDVIPHSALPTGSLSTS